MSAPTSILSVVGSDFSESSMSASAEAETRKLTRRRRNRLQILGMVSASYAVDTSQLALLCAFGAIDAIVPATFAFAALMVCGGFYVVMASGWTNRWRDHYAAVPFLVVNTAVLAGFTAWAPQVGLLMITVLFIVFGFSGLRMDRRDVVLGSVVVALACGSLVAWLGPRLTMPTETVPQRVLCGLWFALVFSRAAMTGLYGAHMREALGARNNQLAATSEKLHHMAHRDELTGALNRRSVMQLVEKARDRMQRSGEVFAVALIDLDHFKQINDRFGHHVGDEVLRRFTVTAASGMRASDRLGRIGGEEFLLLLQTTPDETSAMVATERVRRAVTAHHWQGIGHGLNVTLSAGVAICKDNETAQQLLQRADQALYAAKHEGRDCLRLA
jgi:diguanylate cyclase (GGDEF)-like protein